MCKEKAVAILGSVVAVSMLMSGCSYGIGGTVDLVKQAEKAKDAVESLSSAGAESVCVGTAADPNYNASKLRVDDFAIEYDGESFYAQWAASGMDPTNLQIQIFADTDETGFDGIKISSFSNQELNGAKDFSYELLEPGEYFCYLKATEGKSDPVFRYSTVPVVIEQKPVDGVLSNVQISTDGKVISFSWDLAESAEKYKAYITDDTGTVLGESVVVGNQAKIDFPGNIDTVFAYVSDFTGDILGPAEKVELEKQG